MILRKNDLILSYCRHRPENLQPTILNILMDNIELNFQDFLESHQNFMSDAKKAILKIPKAHQKLVKGYTFKSEGGNTLAGDAGHIGELDEKKRRIKVAAPWYHSREFTFLHEIAHLVWEHIVTDELKSKWMQIVKKTKNKQNHNSHKFMKYKNSGLDQNVEELFCMAYSAAYAKNPPVIYANQEWSKFIEDLPK